MSKFKKAAVSACLLTATLLFPVSALAAVPDYSANLTPLVSYLKTNQGADGGITGFGGETSWTIMGMVDNGIDPHTVQKGGVSLVDFLKNNPPAALSVTGWERDLLAVTAAGENPFTFGGRNYVAQVESFESGNRLGSATSVSGNFWGVLALISAGPSADQTIISKSVAFVIANQNSDGGWSYATVTSSDNADTGVALQALEAAKSKGFTDTGLDNAISTGMDYLKDNQNSDGGWGYAGSGNSDADSTPWVIQSLLGKDTVVTNGLNFLASLQDSSGGVQYQAGDGADTYTSANALIAFGQKAFPIGTFSGTFQEPVTPPVATSSATLISAPKNPNANGKVLAASVLPNTGTNNLIYILGLVFLVSGLIGRSILARLENKLGYEGVSNEKI